MPLDENTRRIIAAAQAAQTSDSQLAEEGFPANYPAAFQRVANAQKCVILTRTPGGSCTGLLAEGYDAKSFHIKGKSCNWGPMTGFVCLDPLLNKGGVEGSQKNLKEHAHSLGDVYESGRKADATPIVISDRRLQWLITAGRVAGSPSTTRSGARRPPAARRGSSITTPGRSTAATRERPSGPTGALPSSRRACPRA